MAPGHKLIVMISMLISNGPRKLGVWKFGVAGRVLCSTLSMLLVVAMIIPTGFVTCAAETYEITHTIVTHRGDS